MKISSSSILMSAQSQKVESYSKEESLKSWEGNERPDFENTKKLLKPEYSSMFDILEISEEAKAKQAQVTNSVQSTEESLLIGTTFQSGREMPNSRTLWS